MNQDKNVAFEPINININREDLRRFTEVAFIIDNPSFVKEATKIRKKYKITKPMKDDDIQQWTLTNIPRGKIPLLFKEITDLRIFFSYDSNYQTVFEKAVFGGVIEDSDYKNTLLLNFAKLPSFLTYLPTQIFGILLTPQTDKKDVATAFKRYQEIQKELNSNEETYASTDKRIDERTEIERDRKWYWKKGRKMKYRQIFKEEGGKDEDFYPNNKAKIKEAILSYKKKLLGQK